MAKYSKPGTASTGPRIIAALGMLAAAALAAAPAAAQVADPARGRALYENHCIVCHTSSVHTRPNRIALTREDVRGMVDHWQRQQNLKWTEQDTEDVVEFLGVTRYRFAPRTGRLGTR